MGDIRGNRFEVTTSAVVLAAGLGRRLRPHTESCPKCLVPVGGRTILERCVNACRQAGVHRIVIVVGYEDQKVRRAVEMLDVAGVEYVVNDRYATTGTARSFALALERTTGQDVILIEGDVLFADELMVRLVSHPDRSATLVDEFQGYSGSLVTVESGQVTSWLHELKRAPTFDTRDTWKTVNLTRFSSGAVTNELPEVLRETLTVEGEAAPLEFALDRWVQGGAKVDVLNTGALPWFEVDTPQDLKQASQLFSRC